MQVSVTVRPRLTRFLGPEKNRANQKPTPNTAVFFPKKPKLLQKICTKNCVKPKNLIVTKTVLIQKSH